MKRGVVPVLFLALIGLASSAAHSIVTPNALSGPSIAIIRPMVIHTVPMVIHTVPMHPPSVHPALPPTVVPRSGALGHPMIVPPFPGRQANPVQVAPPEGVAVPLVAPAVQGAPAATPTPNPLHFRRMALDLTTVLA